MAVVTKRAVRAFLDAPRRDLRKLLDLSDARLQERADALPAAPPLFKRLRYAQQVAFLVAAKYRYAAFHLDTGMGKTLLALALARYFYKLGDLDTLLVLTLTRANKTEWVREIKKHQAAGRLPMDMPYLVLKGSSADKWAAIDDACGGDDPPLAIIETYAGFTRMMCDMVAAKKRGKQKLKPSKSRIKLMQKLVQGIALDESTAAKNHSTNIFRILRQLRKTAHMLVNLTGTPFGRNPEDLWAQFYLVDQGKTLGATLGLFRAALFSEVVDDFGHIEYHYLKKNDKVLHRLLAHSSVAIEADAADLPKVNEVKRYVTMPGEMEGYYNEARRALYAAKGNFQQTRNAFLRMRQISSGFIGYDDDEDGKRAQFEFPFNPKRESLLSLLQEVRPDHKTIVFVDFVFSGSTICRELDKLGLTYARLWGGTKDPDAVRDSWENDPAVQHLVLNNAMGGYGLNLQLAKYGIYFESPVPAILRKQTRRRFERQDSPHKSVFLYDLLVRDTMDEQILKWHHEAGGLFEAIIRGRARV